VGGEGTVIRRSLVPLVVVTVAAGIRRALPIHMSTLGDAVSSGTGEVPGINAAWASLPHVRFPGQAPTPGAMKPVADGWSERGVHRSWAGLDTGWLGGVRPCVGQ